MPSNRPACTVYVLDVSGSMRGERIEALRQALPESAAAVPILPILVRRLQPAGDAGAELTGGHTFDGRAGGLTEVFARIRSSR